MDYRRGEAWYYENSLLIIIFRAAIKMKEMSFGLQNKWYSIGS